MSCLKVEAKIRADWIPVGSLLRKGDRPGSVSNSTSKGREMIVFICQGDRSLLLRSRNGIDIEEEDARTIISSGFHQLAVLTAGDTYQMPITLVFGVTILMRWTHI